MPSEKTLLSIIAILLILLVIVIVYQIYFLPKNQEKLLRLRLDQQKETSELKAKVSNEELEKATLEVNKKVEEISQKLKTSEEVTKVLLENLDKGFKGEITSQQKLFSEKNKELSEKFSK